MELLILLADNAVPSPVSPLAGGSGWVGAGLLGCVLAWLMFWHLPAKDRQVEKLIADKDAHTERMADKFTAALKLVTEHCKEDSKKLAAAFRAELRRLGLRGSDDVDEQ